MILRHSSACIVLFLLIFLAGPEYGHGQNKVPLLGNDSARIEEAVKAAADQAQKGDWREESRFYDNIAFIYWEHNYFDEAAEWYRKSLRLNEKLENNAGISMINSNLGMILSDLKNYEQSLSHFQKTLDYRKMMKDKQGIITTEINMSVVLNNLKRFDESSTLLQDALTQARELNDPDQMKSCYGMLSETYEKARQPDKAKYYFDLYRTFHEEVQKEKEQKARKMVEDAQLQLQLTEAEKKNKELELKLASRELEQKEKELENAGETQRTLYNNLSRTELQNELLQRDNELKETLIANEKERNEKQRTQLVLLLVGLVLFILLGGMILKAYLDKRKTNRLLASQKTEIEQQRDAIGKAYQQLKELTDYKEGIRSMIVHDLKNPLNAILNPPQHYNDALKLDTARKAGRRMLNLVMDFLDVHKMEESHMKIEPAETDAEKLITDAVAEVEYLGQPRGLIFSKTVTAPMTVNCDPGLIHRVLVNLLTNAIKYAYHQSEINIRLEPGAVPNEAIIAVSNTGDGIPDSFIDHVFDKFSQNQARKSGDTGSTGIGLTFCKLAVEAHGGHIGVESIPRQTTTFRFSLKSNEHAPKTTVREAVSAKREEELILSPADEKLLRPVRADLLRLEIHQITKIRKVIRQLDANRNEHIDRWIEKLYMAIESNNIIAYRKLLEKNDHSNPDAPQNTDH